MITTGPHDNTTTFLVAYAILQSLYALLAWLISKRRKKRDNPLTVAEVADRLESIERWRTGIEKRRDETRAGLRRIER